MIKKITIWLIVLNTARVSLAFTQDKPAEVPAAEAGAAAPSANVQDFSVNIKPSGENLYSIELRDAALVDLFRMMSRDYNLNIMVDAKVTGTITATLNNVTIDEALHTIMELKGLKMEQKGKIMVIEPDLVSRIFVLRFVKLSDIVQVETTVTTSATAAPAAAGATTVNTQTASQSLSASYTGKNNFQQCLSGDGYVIPDIQSNSFMVVDYPKNIEKVEKYIKMADRTKEKRIIKLQYVNAKELIQ